MSNLLQLLSPTNNQPRQRVIPKVLHAVAAAEKVRRLPVVLEGEFFWELLGEPHDDLAGFLDDGGAEVAELQDEEGLDDALEPGDYIESDSLPVLLI